MALSLDPTFGIAGVQSLVFPSSGGGGLISLSDPLQAALQPDGKIVTASPVYYGYKMPYPFTSALRVFRLTADGATDTSFGESLFPGDGGDTQLEIPGFTVDFTGTPCPVVILPDGKILVGATVTTDYFTATNGVSNSNFLAAQFLPDGTIDRSFGNGLGYVMVDFSNDDALSCLAVASDGKILLGGSRSLAGADASQGPDARDFAIARLDPGGVLDASFGIGGKQTVAFVPASAAAGGQGSDDQLKALAVGNDGKVVLAGEASALIGVEGFRFSSSDMAVVRLNADGSIDTGFGTDGRRRVAFDLPGGSLNDSVNTLLIQADGRIVLGGSAEAYPGTDPAVARLNIDGSLDAGFGDGGKFTTAIIAQGGRVSSRVTTVFERRGGILTIAGVSSRLGQDFGFLLSLNPAGTVPTASGVVDVQLLADPIMGAALQADGKLVFGVGKSIYRLQADPPEVVGLTLEAFSGHGRKRTFRQLSLQLAGASLEPSHLAKAKAYTVRLGSNRRPLPVKSVTYNAATDLLRIRLASAAKMPVNQALRVRIDPPRLADSAGRLLDGGGTLDLVASSR